MSASFDFKAPEAFAVGTVGPVGQRVFYLQIREAGVLVTLKVEKEQVRALSEYLANLLTRLPPTESAPEEVALDEPILPAWAVRSLGVGYDEGRDRIVIVAEELVEDEEEGEGQKEEGEEGGATAERESASARFLVSRAQAAAFVTRARKLIEAGRKPCPTCGRPMNPGGHICPRLNGHGRD